MFPCSIAYMRVQEQAGPNTTVPRIRQNGQSLWLLNVSIRMVGRCCRWQRLTGGAIASVEKHSSVRQFRPARVRINIAR